MTKRHFIVLDLRKLPYETCWLLLKQLPAYVLRRYANKVKPEFAKTATKDELATFVANNRLQLFNSLSISFHDSVS